MEKEYDLDEVREEYALRIVNNMTISQLYNYAIENKVEELGYMTSGELLRDLKLDFPDLYDDLIGSD